MKCAVNTILNGVYIPSECSRRYDTAGLHIHYSYNNFERKKAYALAMKAMNTIHRNFPGYGSLVAMNSRNPAGIDLYVSPTKAFMEARNTVKGITTEKQLSHTRKKELIKDALEREVRIIGQNQYEFGGEIFPSMEDAITEQRKYYTNLELGISKDGKILNKISKANPLTESLGLKYIGKEVFAITYTTEEVSSIIEKGSFERIVDGAKMRVITTKGLKEAVSAQIESEGKTYNVIVNHVSGSSPKLQDNGKMSLTAMAEYLDGFPEYFNTITHKIISEVIADYFPARNPNTSTWTDYEKQEFISQDLTPKRLAEAFKVKTEKEFARIDADALRSEIYKKLGSDKKVLEILQLIPDNLLKTISVEVFLSNTSSFIMLNPSSLSARLDLPRMEAAEFLATAAAIIARESGFGSTDLKNVYRFFDRNGTLATASDAYNILSSEAQRYFNSIDLEQSLSGTRDYAFLMRVAKEFSQVGNTNLITSKIYMQEDSKRNKETIQITFLHEFGHHIDSLLTSMGHAPLIDTIRAFAQDLAKLPEFEQYFEALKRERGYESDNIDEITADIIAVSIARQHGIDLSKEEFATFNLLAKALETSSATDKFLEHFDKPELDEYTKDVQNIFDALKNWLVTAVKAFNEFFGTNLFKIVGQKVKLNVSENNNKSVEDIFTAFAKMVLNKSLYDEGMIDRYYQYELDRLNIPQLTGLSAITHNITTRAYSKNDRLIPQVVDDTVYPTTDLIPLEKYSKEGIKEELSSVSIEAEGVVYTLNDPDFDIKVNQINHVFGQTVNNLGKTEINAFEIPGIKETKDGRNFLYALIAQNVIEGKYGEENINEMLDELSNNEDSDLMFFFDGITFHVEKKTAEFQPYEIDIEFNEDFLQTIEEVTNTDTKPTIEAVKEEYPELEEVTIEELNKMKLCQ